MSSWFVVNLGDALMASADMQRIKMLCESEYAEAIDSHELAIFYRHESEGSLHCEVKVYFSPHAATVAQDFGALVCAKPSALGLGLLVGTVEAQARLFQEKV